ncbi:LysR substrate-binding domain-containing protein [Actinoplanes xinjiangensis]|uniref:LysR substrate binding domain-containing protein n=1 Tax=Actinoplanes xinjiangensis TaxID=512350 RepID=A0A316EBI6_9ACTN|nr:LysR substrate-binding domain-containing protein [Actinoplanes xinjiangensis]PWK27487.1 LysR substrate binding domain-containing protein [Actinoplanes xinjiangensis]GIF45291.1 hypothetical protein Axi01nite_96020 [Actinoplanes xinjiangensis]
MSRTVIARVIRAFHQVHPETELDLMKLFEVETAVAALRSGAIDAAFRPVAMPGRPIPEDIAGVRVLDEPLHLLTGPAHALTAARSVTPAQLVGHGLRRIPVTGPTPVYPHSLLWHRDIRNPALAALRDHLAATKTGHDRPGTWTPNWVSRT